MEKFGNIYTNSSSHYNPTFNQRMAMSVADQVALAADNRLGYNLGVKLSSNTPAVLHDMGIVDRPIFIKVHHVADAVKPFNDDLHHHGLTQEQVVDAVNKMGNPLFVFDSDKKDDSICVFLNDFGPSAQGINDSPLLVTLHLDGYEKDENKVDQNVHYVTGLYGKRIGALFQQLGYAIAENRLLYVDKEQLAQVAEQFGRMSQYNHAGLEDIPSKAILHSSHAAEFVKNNKEHADNYYKSGQSRIDDFKRKHDEAVRKQTREQGKIVVQGNIFDR